MNTVCRRLLFQACTRHVRPTLAVCQAPNCKRYASELPTVATSATEDITDHELQEDLAKFNGAGSILRNLAAPDIVRERPKLSTFKRGGFPRDIVKNLNDFPHALLLTRVGQFYESYFDQAIEIADLLKIRLTTKSMESKRYPMCGFPIAQMDKFLEKLVRINNRFVAICEEFKHFDDEGKLKNIERKVTRVVTPGTLVDEVFVDKKEHNFLLAIDVDVMSDKLELAWIDTSTGELFSQASTISERSLGEDLARIKPAEIILPALLGAVQQIDHPIHLLIANLEARPKIAYPRREIVEESNADEARSAIPLLAAYISETLLEHQPDLSHPLRMRSTNSMLIDRVSLKALEIRQNNDGGVKGTLISVLDRTVTAPGMRLLTDRIMAPSKSIPEINGRLSLVSFFKSGAFLRDTIVGKLRQLDDEARLLQKMSIGRPTAEDLLTMARAIRVHNEIRETLIKEVPLIEARGLIATEDIDQIRSLAGRLHDHSDLAHQIENAINIQALEMRRDQAPPADSGLPQAQPESIEAEEEEGIDIWDIPFDVATGKSKRGSKSDEDAISSVDDASMNSKGKALPAAVSWGKTEATVMQPSSSPIMTNLNKSILKVEARARRFHRELVKQIDALPFEVVLRVVPRFGPVIRIGWKRTHSPAMRDAIANLDAKGTITLVRKAAQARLFSHNTWTKLNSEMQGLLVQLREAENLAVRELCNQVLSDWHTLRQNASVTAELDVAASFAKVADELKLTKPVVHDGDSIHIEQGRHPVAEHELTKTGQPFEPNDTAINNACRLHVITGPNMGGKSTYLRQVGLISAMAQAGSFVPASAATIGIVDQLFARIRYSDNIARGRSSFRVEMDDAAYILENATSKSLVLLDEFGRGTTADYAACIAEATIYALAQNIRARSLFATHLHDIYDILHDNHEDRREVVNSVEFFCTHVSEKQQDDQTTLQYQYKLSSGVNRDAEAFKVAKAAGYPRHLLERAQRIYVSQASNQHSTKT